MFDDVWWFIQPTACPRISADWLKGKKSPETPVMESPWKIQWKMRSFSGQIVPTNQSNDIFPICSGFYQHFPMFSEGGPRIFPCFPTFSECFLRFPRVFPCFPSGFLGFSEGFPLGIPSGYGVELAGAVRQGFGIGAHDLPSCDGEILGHRTWWERANHGMIVNDDSLWIHPSTFPMEVFGAPC